MDQRGSLVDTNIKIFPSEKLIAFIELIPTSDDIPLNIRKYIKGSAEGTLKENEKSNIPPVQYTSDDIKLLNRIKIATENNSVNGASENNEEVENLENNNKCPSQKKIKDYKENNEIANNQSINDSDPKENIEKLFLTTSDIDWVYAHIVSRKNKGEENVPFLHELFQGTDIVMPENKVLKRNPVLEARCVKLRAQQEAREYRKMTKGVDNVRMRYPEDSISYQLKQLNRQLIAIGQFIISIFAGFLFGFRGVEWMIGNLDFGVRLLLGVMCALIIALAEIYFLAKKLNEELTMTETVQLGGPPKFASQIDNRILNSTPNNKEHID